MFGQQTYLIFVLVWALPVLALQWYVGSRLLWPRRALLVLAAALPTAYLTAADAVALRQGIWVLHSNRITGLHLGTVPIEESIFFFVTNLLVAQSVILVVCGWTANGRVVSLRLPFRHMRPSAESGEKSI